MNDVEFLDERKFEKDTYKPLIDKRGQTVKMNICRRLFCNIEYAKILLFTILFIVIVLIVFVIVKSDT